MLIAFFHWAMSRDQCVRQMAHFIEVKNNKGSDADKSQIASLICTATLSFLVTRDQKRIVAEYKLGAI
jgi:hypothetical protein